MILLKNIKLKKDDNELLREKIGKILGINQDFSFEIYKKSIDARKGITFNYQVLVDGDIPSAKVEKIKDATYFHEEEYNIPKPHNKKSTVIIIGSGPSGLFCAYTLAKYGFKPIVIERGEPITQRIVSIENFLETAQLNEESNVQFGEGGAGTFSDGKLTSRSKDKRVREVLKTFQSHGAPKDILYESKPHIGTDQLKHVLESMRDYIISQGGEYHFNSKMEDLEIEKGNVKSITVNGKKLYGDRYILALGNSARDTFYMLLEKLELENKPFAIGFRIEHLQSDISRSQYKGEYDNLPPASYMLTYNDKELNLSGYTFCMCPGGYVINASSEKGHLCVNGMSFHKRDGRNANSALIVTVDESIYGTNLLDGIVFQREIEEKAFLLGSSKFLAPVQKVGDFLKNVPTKELGSINPTVRPGYVLSNLRGLYPPIIDEMITRSILDMNKMLKGFSMEDAILTGVETRSSSPVRILRDENLKALNIDNLYPIGEGSGYAGGIVSSAVDGIKAAEKIIQK